MQRVTRGDAQAILNAGGTGGLASSITGQALGAAPADVLGLAPFDPMPTTRITALRTGTQLLMRS
jgi:hypothetical protein